MTKAQLTHFAGLSLKTAQGMSTFGIASATMLIMKIGPKITSRIPPSLFAVSLLSIVSAVFQFPVTTLADVAGASTFAGGWQVLPSFGLPSVPISWTTFQTIFPYAVTTAAVGSIESLLTMQLLDGIADDGKQGSTRKEMAAQGTGNLVSGLFGGIGGCALLGQSIINMQSGGGVSRWSGMSMALFLAAGIVATAPLLATSLLPV
jgi:SulP family sulfate permease